MAISAEVAPEAIVMQTGPPSNPRETRTPDGSELDDFQSVPSDESIPRPGSDGSRSDFCCAFLRVSGFATSSTGSIYTDCSEPA